jgi:hypothetical protein
MGEVLFWTVAVFAVLGGPPLLVLWSELRRERKEAEQRERQRRFDEKQMRRRGEASGSSSSTGV